MTVGNGQAVLDTARTLGLEGVVAKRVDSPYRRGRRSAAWRKVKITAQQEFVVGGWIPGEGRLDTTVGALIVGYHDGPGRPAALRGPGRFRPRRRDPRPVPAHVACAGRLPLRSAASHGGPTDRAMGRAGVVVEVRFTMWTTDDVLRNPVYLGERDDKPAARRRARADDMT